MLRISSFHTPTDVLQKEEKPPIHTAFKVRRYRWYDLEKVMKLFYDTVHHVCEKDYSPEQLEAWAPETLDRKAWKQSLRSNICFVAESKKELIGFGDLKAGGGEINRLYTHKDYQGLGVAKAIYQELERAAQKFQQDRLLVESSLTGKNFYQRQGFVCTDVVPSYLQDQVFFNYLMEKKLLQVK